MSLNSSVHFFFSQHIIQLTWAAISLESRRFMLCWVFFFSSAISLFSFSIAMAYSFLTAASSCFMFSMVDRFSRLSFAHNSCCRFTASSLLLVISCCCCFSHWILAFSNAFLAFCSYCLSSWALKRIYGKNLESIGVTNKEWPISPKASIGFQNTE